jgi:thiamine biosynthesis lipoprotein
MKAPPQTLLLLAAGLSLLTSCTTEPPDVAEKAFTIEEVNGRIMVPYSDAKRLNTLVFETRQKILPLLTLFDSFEETSEISTINRVTGASRVPVSRDTMRLLKHAVQFGEMSKGAFDITTPPVSALWGFHNGTPPERPLPESVRAAALRGVGYDKIDLLDQSVLLTTPYTQIDVSCLSAGYALDIAFLSHRSKGVPSMFLQYGSNTRVLGERSAGSPWTQPLRIPHTGQSIGTIDFGGFPAIHVQEPSSEYVEIAGQKFYNTINPKTGDAVNYNFLVVAAAKSATKAAALGYALVSHEVSEAQKIIDDFGECAALVIPNSDPFQIWLSEGAETTFQIDPALPQELQQKPPAPKAEPVRDE